MNLTELADAVKFARQAQSERAERVRVSRDLLEHMRALAAASEAPLWTRGGAPGFPLGVSVVLDESLTGMEWEVDR